MWKSEVAENCFRELLLMKRCWGKGDDNKAAVGSICRYEERLAHTRCWKEHLPFPDRTAASGTVLYFPLHFLLTRSKHFLRTSYNGISVWWE